LNTEGKAATSPQFKNNDEKADMELSLLIPSWKCGNFIGLLQRPGLKLRPTIA
jgi:hypothetical protein